MTAILIITTLAFIGMLCVHQLGKWSERRLWIKWADSDPDLWPDHLADVDRRKLSDTPTPKARRIQMFKSGFENGELAATRRHARLEKIEVAEQAAS